MTLILGDIHGKIQQLEKTIQQHNPQQVILVGDIGLGFEEGLDREYEFFSGRIFQQVKFIRGNHDHKQTCQTFTPNKGNMHYIPDGTIENGTLYIGGAYSIDWKYRTPGINWWFDEEINYQEQEQIEQTIKNHDGEIHTLITHDAPFRLYQKLGIKIAHENTTAWFLDQLMTHHLTGNKKPKNWYFGHHHKTIQFTHDNIQFRCINSIETGDHVTLSQNS